MTRPGPAAAGPAHAGRGPGDATRGSVPTDDPRTGVFP